MKMYGHEKVKILNGGMAQWKAVGGEVEKGKEKARDHKKYVITDDKVDHHIFADKHEVLKASNMIMRAVKKHGDKTRSGYAILDSRSMIEIIGGNKLDKVARGGHVPGATFMEWKQVTDFENKLSYPADLNAVQAKLDSIGLTKDKKIYTYCHVGAGRGSYFWALMNMLGYENVKVYTGSWDEWGNDMSLPIQK
jgi:thiosulfate/3-mercaptopyruvate sulfurtransferase